MIKILGKVGKSKLKTTNVVFNLQNVILNHMQKTTKIGVIIAGIIIIGLGVFLITQKKSSNELEQIPTDSSVTENAPQGKKMAFSELVKQGDAYQCTVTQYIDSTFTATTEGKVFIAGGKVRGNFSTQVEGMNVDTSMIARDGLVHTWTSLANIGITTKQVKNTEEEKPVETSGQFSWNDEMIGDYDCQDWKEDTSVFEVPKNITFKAI